MSDHYQGMVDMRSDIRNATHDQLIACLLELLDDSEVNQSAHLLATIARHTDLATLRYRNRLAQMKPAESCATERTT